MEKAREFQKNICFIYYAKAFDSVSHSKLWKTLKRWKYQTDHLNSLLRNLPKGQKETVRTGCGTTDWLKLESEYICIKFYAENIK